MCCRKLKVSLLSCLTYNLEKVQRQAARFITGNYSTKDHGCVTRMLDSLKLPSLQDRRKANRLVFFYKVVGGQVPALPSQAYLTPLLQNRRRVAVKRYTSKLTTFWRVIPQIIQGALNRLIVIVKFIRINFSQKLSLIGIIWKRTLCMPSH